MVLVPDLAGGRLTFQMSDASHTHKQLLRVTQFAVADGRYDIPLAVAAGKVNFNGDIDWMSTANAWMDVVKAIYGTDWTISCVKAETRADGTAAAPWTEVPVPNGVAPRAGVFAPFTDRMHHYTQTTFTGKDYQLHRVKIVFIGAAYVNYKPMLMPNSGSGQHDAIWAFVADANHPVVSHNGQGIRPTARMVATFNRRLRRRYGDA